MDVKTMKKELENTIDEDRWSVKDFQRIAHNTAKEKGWWQDWDRNVPEQIALMHSELSEALEEFRNSGADHVAKTFYQSDTKTDKPEGFGVELADCVIRILDTCGRYGIDLEACLRTKMLYNLTRPHRHGGKAC